MAIYFGDFNSNNSIPASAVYNQRSVNDLNRRTLSAEILDTYAGYGLSYIRSYLSATINNTGIKEEMLKVAVCLPLLKYFYDSISLVYDKQPDRRFFIDDREIVCELPNNIQDPSKFYVDELLHDKLMKLYNNNVCTALQQAEKYTNLFGTTVYKVVTDAEGCLNIVYQQNEAISCLYDFTQMTDIKLFPLYDANNTNLTFNVMEEWTAKEWKIYKGGKDVETRPNRCFNESINLFGTPSIGYGYAPFVVFRNTGSPLSFWDAKDHDIFYYIKQLNVQLSNLAYLIKYSSFGLKYAVNVKIPTDAVIDPIGILQFGVDTSSLSNIPRGVDSNKNWEVGEFDNQGRIKEVVEAIIFSMKMIFSMFNIPLDSLVSTNSNKSAESKLVDNERLYSYVNSQREVWYSNEQNLFKVLQSVYNRDYADKLPAGIEMTVNFSDKEDARTTNEWLVLLQNNVVSILDWLSEYNPDLDRDELATLLTTNVDINSYLQKFESNQGEGDDSTPNNNT